MTEFKSYWQGLSPEEKERLAKDAQTSVATLSQIANGHRNAGLNMCRRLERARPVLTAEFLRPDLYGDVAAHA